MNNQGKSFRKFLLLWSGEFISAIGSGLTAFGLGIYVFNQTGKASAMALVTLLGFMPSLLLSAVTGVLADRYDRRLLMVLGNSFSVFGLLFILICVLKGEAQLWQICVGVTITSVFSSLLEPAYKATITDLLTEDQYTKASGLVQVAGSSKYLISPIIAGFLLTVSDIKLLLVIDICTFIITVILTLAVAYALAGLLADYVFTPLLLDNGILADSVGIIIGTGIGRGTGFLIIIAGLLLSVTSIILYNVKAVKKLENRGDLYVLQNNSQ